MTHMPQDTSDEWPPEKQDRVLKLVHNLGFAADARLWVCSTFIVSLFVMHYTSCTLLAPYDQIAATKPDFFSRVTFSSTFMIYQQSGARSSAS
ncbi:hypothetical protein BH18ACI4_BH18ACI4_16270 [soil metagenome]